MRRLIAFIVLTISMLGLVLFNVQGINENLSYSQEFANGTEVLYKISGAGNEETTIDIDNVVSVMGDRLEASGATNYSIQKASDGENNYEVKIVLGSRNSNNVDNILRSVGSSGNFSFYTTDGTDGTDSDPIIPGSAEVLYNYQNQAYIRLEVTSEVQGVINNAKDEVGNSLLVLWQGKTDDLDYTDLADTNYVSETFGMTGEQLQSKVLAVIDLSESSSDSTTTSSAYDPHRVWKTTTGESEGIDNSTFTVEGEGEDARYYLTFAAYGYAANTESTILMNAESAHSFERMFNQKSLSNYEITEVYRRSYTPEYGSDAVMWMNVTFIVSTLLVCLFLLVSYGFMAISGAIGVALTALADMFILNLFGFIVNPITIISIVVTFGFAVNMLCVYYRRIKEEVYLGRVISKASAEGFRKTISTAVDTTVIFLVLGIVLSLLSRQSIQNFALFFVFSSLLSVILVFLVSRILNHFLFNSKLETKHKLYRINDKYINDSGDGTSLVPENSIQKLNVKKGFKATLGVYLGLVALSAVSLITLGFTAGAFNYNSFEPFGRIEVRTSIETLFEEKMPDNFTPVEGTQLDNFVAYINSFGEVEVTNSWVVTNMENPFGKEGDTYLYFYADLSSPLSLDSETYIALDNFVRTFDTMEGYEGPMINSYTVTPGIVTSDFYNTFVLMGVSLGIVFVYFLIRYRYTMALASIISVAGSTFIAIAILSLARFETSAYLGIAILGGMLLSLLFMIPFGTSLNQLKNESKIKITTSDQRVELLEKAYKRNVTQMGLSFVCFTVLSLVLIPFSPIGMMNIYIVFAITLFINGVFAVFMVTPLASVFEKKFKNTKLKERRAKKLMAKREKLAKQNRNKGAEPEEIIIPGIND